MTFLRRHAGLFAALAAILAVALSFDVVDAASSTGPVPATTNTVTLTAAPVTGLTDGQTITYSVATSGSTTLTGAVTAHLCKHGLTGYTTSNFGYSGSQGVRCVYQAGIVSGGLTSADYEATQNFFQATSTGALAFKAGTGSLVWGSVTGQGPLSIQCDSSNPCDLVVQVNLTGDSVATTYFIQPLEYGGGGGPTTTTTSTTARRPPAPRRLRPPRPRARRPRPRRRRRHRPRSRRRPRRPRRHRRPSRRRPRRPPRPAPRCPRRRQRRAPGAVAARSRRRSRHLAVS